MSKKRRKKYTIKKNTKWLKKKAVHIKGWALMCILLVSGSNHDQNRSLDSDLNHSNIFDNTAVLKSAGGTDVPVTKGLDSDGQGTQSYPTAGNRQVRWKSNVVWASNKLINRKVKARNGNRSPNSMIKIIHWNVGSKLWQNQNY